MTPHKKAEAYVRAKLPELMEENWKWARVAGLEKAEEVRSLEIIGHPIHLQHWLRVIGEKEQVSSSLTAIASNGCIYKNGTVVMQFDLTTGQPATEADYQAFNDIVGA